MIYRGGIAQGGSGTYPEFPGTHTLNPGNRVWDGGCMRNSGYGGVIRKSKSKIWNPGVVTRLG